MTAAIQRAEQRELPILFKGRLVRAILEGRKTQTRRVMSPKLVEAISFYDCDEARDARVTFEIEAHSGPGWYVHCTEYPEEGYQFLGPTSPYGAPGDRLWVKETWQYADWTEDGLPFVRYQADDAKMLRERIPGDWAERLTDTWAELSEAKNYAIDGRAADRRWRPSIFLPRWGSRIDLEVAEVRVQRLQDISEEDAIAEGVERTTSVGPLRAMGWRGHERAHLRAAGAFASLWDSINAARGFGWDANPWVWAITFRRARP